MQLVSKGVNVSKNGLTDKVNFIQKFDMVRENFSQMNSINIKY